MRHLIHGFLGDDRGQDLIEYALLCGFVTLGVVIAATNLGSAVNGIFSAVGHAVASVPGP